MKQLQTVLALLFLFQLTVVHADTICGMSGCRVQMDFASGGSIEVPDGMVIQFGSNGSVDLGATGALDLGSGGSLDGATESDLFDGTVLALGQTLTFGEGGELMFEAGGSMDLGEGGNIEYPAGGNIAVNTASTVTMEDQGDYDFVIEQLTGLGSYYGEGELLVSGNPEGSGLSFLNGSNTSHFVTDFPAVTINDLGDVSGSITTGGSQTYNNEVLLAGDTTFAVEDEGSIIFSGSFDAQGNDVTIDTYATDSYGSGTEFSSATFGTGLTMSLVTDAPTTFTYADGASSIIVNTDVGPVDVTDSVLEAAEEANCEDSNTACDTVEVSSDGDVSVGEGQEDEQAGPDEQLALAWYMDKDDGEAGSASLLLLMCLVLAGLRRQLVIACL